MTAHQNINDEPPMVEEKRDSSPPDAPPMETAPMIPAKEVARPAPETLVFLPRQRLSNPKKHDSMMKKESDSVEKKSDDNANGDASTPLTMEVASMIPAKEVVRRGSDTLVFLPRQRTNQKKQQEEKHPPPTQNCQCPPPRGSADAVPQMQMPGAYAAGGCCGPTPVDANANGDYQNESQQNETPNHGGDASSLGALEDSNDASSLGALEDASSLADLSVAFPIEDSSHSSYQQAQEVDLEEENARTPKRKKNGIFLGLGLCTIPLLVLVVVVLVVPFSKKQYDGHTLAPTESPSQAPTLSLESHVLELLQLPDDDTLDALQDAASPQSSALQWLLLDHDPSVLWSLSERRIQQRYGLATTYWATQGPVEWFQNDDWLDPNAHECQWWHTEVHDEDYEYIQVKYNNSCEEVPDVELDVEDDRGTFQHFWMRGNNLGGELPLEFFHYLTHLRSLNADGCHLGGSLPTAIGRLAALEDVSVGANQLMGSLPSELFALTNLTGLFLQYNRFSGTIPSLIGQLSNLNFWVADRNILSGTIPPQVRTMTSLYWLNWGRNPLEGTIPTQIGALSSVWGVEFSGCLLTGTLPSQVGHLQGATDLAYQENLISGTVPAQIGTLNISMETWLGQDNLHSGTIPTELGNLERLRRLSLQQNQLSGRIPSQLGRCDNLLGIQLYENSLTGSVPSELGLCDMWRFDVEDNALSGSLPAELRSWNDLDIFAVRSNRLTGIVPQELCNTTTVTAFDCNPLCGCDCACNASSTPDVV